MQLCACWIASAVAVLFLWPMFGQQTAELIGHVIDPSGAIVVGANVEATNESTGVGRLASILKGFEESSAIYVAQAQRWHPEIRRRADDEHQALVEAFRARDAERAVEVMRGHSAMPIEMTKPEERGTG